MIGLTIGPVHTLLSNVIYALPARKVFAHIDSVAATITIGNEETLTAEPYAILLSTWQTTGARATGVELGAAFIRSDGADSLIRLTV